MSRFIFVTWYGGGNLTPALGIARVLAERQHVVEFLGDATQRQRIESAGLAFTAHAQPPSGDGETPTTPRERQQRLLRDVWMNDQLADDLLALLAHKPADMVVVDCMLAGVLSRSADFGAPTAVLVHSLYEPVLPLRDMLVTMGNQLRVQSGRAELDTAAVQWERKDLVLVTTLPPRVRWRDQHRAECALRGTHPRPDVCSRRLVTLLGRQ
jgi:UDP:flavonoid glycosyltransferase YjiC (YdhE family)